MIDANSAIEEHNRSLGVICILTYRCNFNCKTCADPLTNKKGYIDKTLKKTDFEDFMHFLSKANSEFENNEPKFEWISFTGGEITTLPFETIKQMSEISHNYGFKTSMFTNGSKEEELLDFDGDLDQIVISHHSSKSPVINWACKFKKTAIVVNKLVNVESFSTFESFNNFVEEIIKADVNYRQRFSTHGYNTPEFKEQHPDWVDSVFATERSLTKYSKRIVYKGFEFKFSEYSCMNSRTFIQHPNGCVNTTWENDLSELNYRDLNQCHLIKNKLNMLNQQFLIKSVHTQS